ncbi:VCBS repeat-containing protein [Foetidibacter luteolus]|uniref:VCBS repeat-containing protein n=1 Tax=Foetidibacter luteolus TaxID=2608880 RepID=UPI00129AFB2D|nr:VCBS repeat-containing protein [Foetidibacter luteolus]
MIKTAFSLLACFIAVLVTAQKTAPLFTLMEEKQTGVVFLNEIKEDDSLHVMRYEYLYNGAGVGIADFNNDGWNDIFFSGTTTPNKLFLNKQNFQFTDVTKQAEVAGNGTWATGVSIADVNGDGLWDIYVCHSGYYHNPQQLSNELYINQGVQNNVPVFKEMAAAYGLDAPGTQSTQAAFFDYDNDGDLDMFLLNHSNHSIDPFLNTRKIRATPNFNFGNRLFRNDRDANGNMHFTDVTLAAGIINNAINFGLSVTISDVNRDGWPDIYTTSDYTERDCFYINNRNGTFTESLSKSFTHISKYSMGADIADYNNDGRPDVFTLDMLPEDNHRQKLLKGPDEYDKYHLLLDSGYYHQQMRNMLQLNEGQDMMGNTRFSEIGQLAGVSNTDWSWAGLFADFDNDGWKDLFISNGYLRDFTDMDFLKYTVADAKIAAAKEGHQNFQTFDLVRKMPSNKLNNYIFQNNHQLGFSNMTREWGFEKPSVSNAAAYADLDNDGDLDLVICNNNEPALLYRNNTNTSRPVHFVKLRLSGEGANAKAFGATVTITTSDGKTQYQELYPVRGYQSTVAPELLFGLSNQQTLQQIKIVWSGKKETLLTNIKVDTILNIQQTTASITTSTARASQPFFQDVTSASGLHFRHTENDFVDFKDEVLLPYQLSKQGPAMAKADVNGDGLEDLFFGGAINQPGMLFLQNEGGDFRIAASNPWLIDSANEDVNALFFDADKDGDQDLYVVSGGNEYGDGSPEYADRLYLNDGKGNFQKANTALPDMLSSKKAVAAGDFDNDGDLDLFVGGQSIPGSFPLAAKSYLLRNDSKDGNVTFTDVTTDITNNLREAGMVNIAQWVDLDNDNYPELLIGGDWMNILLFKNTKGRLEDISKKAGIEHLSGMWSAIKATDIDGDGDTDFILGNCGYNNQFKASKEQPVTLYAYDFDDNGTIDPIMCYYIQGKSYPMASRDELLDQVVPLKKKFVKYKDYADATIEKIFPSTKISDARQYKCNELASGILYNNGNLQFSFTALPIEAQFSRVYGAVADDFDKDGIKDILISGNFFPYRVQLGRCDAGLGMLLKGNRDKTFTAVDPTLSGCYADGDIRAMDTLKNKSGDTLIIIGKNDAAVQVLKLTK